MKLITVVAAAAVLALSAGAVLAAEACACCKDMAPGAAMGCCDDAKAGDQTPEPAPDPAPTPAPQADAPHAGHTPG